MTLQHQPDIRLSESSHMRPKARHVDDAILLPGHPTPSREAVSRCRLVVPAVRVNVTLPQSQLHQLTTDHVRHGASMVSAQRRSPALRRGGEHAAGRGTEGPEGRLPQPARHEEEVRWARSVPGCTQPTWRLRAQRERPSRSLVF